MLKELSEDVSRLVAAVSGRLVHIGGAGIPGRTGLVWSDTLVVTLAREAEDGESVPLLLPGGKETTATVKAFDSRTGLTLLEAKGLDAKAWVPAPTPAVGSLAVTVAFASPGGVEARLDAVRFVGGATEWGRGGSLKQHLQTDGNSFPGFSGAPVVDPEGRLIGIVAVNRPGNEGFVVTAADLTDHVASLLAKGTRRKAYLGVTTRPTGTEQGLAITEVEADSPADKAGLKAGDLLLSLGGEALAHPMQLAKTLSKLDAGVAVEAKVLRAGAVLAISVVPGGR